MLVVGKDTQKGYYTGGVYYANFQKKADATFTYSVIDNTGGSVDNAAETVPAFGTAPRGSTATPAPGYKFEGWYKNASHEAADKIDSPEKLVPQTTDGIYVSANYYAYFVEADPFTIKFEAKTGGSVSPSEVTDVYPISSSSVSSSTATPSAGYKFSH